MSRLRDAIQRHGTINPERIALDPIVGSPVTYAELPQRIEQVRAALVGEFRRRPGRLATGSRRGDSAARVGALRKPKFRSCRCRSFSPMPNVSTQSIPAAPRNCFPAGTRPAYFPHLGQSRFLPGPRGSPSPPALPAIRKAFVFRKNICWWWRKKWSARSALPMPEGTWRCCRRASCLRQWRDSSRRYWPGGPMSAHPRPSSEWPIPSGPISH